MNTIAYCVILGTVSRLPEQVRTLSGKTLPVWEMNITIMQPGAWCTATRSRGADEPAPITLRVKQGAPLQYAQTVRHGDSVQATGRVYMRRRQDARGELWYTPEFYLDTITLQPAAPAATAPPAAADSRRQALAHNPGQGGSAPAELGYAAPASQATMPYENADDIPF